VEELNADAVVDDWCRFSKIRRGFGSGLVPFRPMFPYSAAAIKAVTIARALPTVDHAYGEMPR